MRERFLLVYKDTAEREENPGTMVLSKRSCGKAVGHATGHGGS